jgi:Ca-activated chloride channel family protein
MKLKPDDPRLTAYVLDELDPAEREAVAAEIQQSERLYAEAMEMYETASWLKEELKQAPLTGLDAGRTAAIQEAIEQRGVSLETSTPQPGTEDAEPANVVAFPRLLWRWAAAGVALAACVTLVFVLWQRWQEQEAQLAQLEESQRSAERASTARVNTLPGPTGESQPLAPAARTPEQPPPAPAPAAQPPPSATPAPTTPPPAMDIRMLMRYGLLPRGARVPAEAFPPTPAPGTPSLAAGRPGTQGSAADPWSFRGGHGRYKSGRDPSAPGTESYAHITENPFTDPVQEPLSTFGLDVDTASYSLVRRFLNEGRMPPPDAVRIEELINYFPYNYAPPRDEAPFAVHLEVAGCPWNMAHRLVRVGVKAREITASQRPPCNLVFLIDVSGSMEPANKLPLLRQGLRMLVERLRPEDTVAIVVYASDSRVVLPPTSGAQREEILRALDALHAGGSTNGGAGLQTAYSLAQRDFQTEGVNRVILCTDGDFNVGITSPTELTRVIEEKARAGVFLSVLGFGVGNLKDSTMEQLADCGNGNYAYIDTLNEAHKVLIAQMSGTLVTVAKDVKVQVEFNPAHVRTYRLIGYENRLLAAEDFNDDRRDAGDIGAGHSVTGLYEIEPASLGGDRAGVDPLKYQPSTRSARPRTAASELLTLKVRFKEPTGDTSRLLTFPLVDTGRSYGQASPDFKFAASVAAFGMILRHSPHRGTATWDGVLELGGEGVGRDAEGLRAEFLGLVRRAQHLNPRR